MQTGSCAAVDIVDKKNLPAGNYEEQDSFIVGDRIYQGLADAVEPVTGITNGAENSSKFSGQRISELTEMKIRRIEHRRIDNGTGGCLSDTNRPVIDTRWTRGSSKLCNDYF